MAVDLTPLRTELRDLLREYSKEVINTKTEEEVFREEVEYAASGLKNDDITERIKSVEFLEILGENPFAQDYLLLALDDKESSVVQKAIHALGKVANKQVVPKLHEFMKSTTSKHLISEIGRILTKIDKRI